MYKTASSSNEIVQPPVQWLPYVIYLGGRIISRRLSSAYLLNLTPFEV